VIGRFYSNDPVGVRDTHSFNRYSYANNNPYKFTDPTGMTSESKNKGSGFCGVSGCDYSYKSGDSKTDSDDDPTWETYIPGTAAGDSAAQFWADRVVTSEWYEDPTARAGLFFSVLWTDKTAADTAMTLAGGGIARGMSWAMGPAKQWIRFGPSYSRELGQNIQLSIRWGASPAGGGKYIKQIPSTTMQRVNQSFRQLKLPGSNWRTQDPGHLHLKK